MIRVFKSKDAPASLSGGISWNREDVQKQLIEDQHGKCYICERNCGTDYQVEHYKSRSKHPSLSSEWNNLFLSCGYCNGKKQRGFDVLLNPADVNIEEEIEQMIDYSERKAIFRNKSESPYHIETIRLLESVFNGRKSMRTVRETKFFNHVLNVMTGFRKKVYDYLENPNKENTDAVRDELSLDKELLGFKYWIIRSNDTLNSVFGSDMKWNRI